jgi:uncharacterized membrane protein HdeD (DUF308 family)
MSIDLINKNKIRADNYITVLMVIIYGLFAFFFHLEALVSLIVYPFGALVAYGALKIFNFFNNRNNPETHPITLLFGIVCIIVSILFIWFIMAQPAITSQLIMILISFPMIIVGFAGIIKGSMIELYSIKQRIMTVIIGFITIVMSFLIFGRLFNDLLFTILILSLTLLVNVLSRAALYLSEYGLSIIHLKNIKIFFYIISDYLIYIDRSGNLILSKI